MMVTKIMEISSGEVIYILEFMKEKCKTELIS